MRIILKEKYFISITAKNRPVGPNGLNIKVVIIKDNNNRNVLTK